MAFLRSTCSLGWASISSFVGREGGREGGREKRECIKGHVKRSRGREGGKEGGREGVEREGVGREEGREGGREGGRKGGGGVRAREGGRKWRLREGESGEGGREGVERGGGRTHCHFQRQLKMLGLYKLLHLLVVRLGLQLVDLCLAGHQDVPGREGVNQILTCDQDWLSVL